MYKDYQGTMGVLVRGYVGNILISTHTSASQAPREISLRTPMPRPFFLEHSRRRPPLLCIKIIAITMRVITITEQKKMITIVMKIIPSP